MPNRILKESICTSDNIDQLSPFAEIAFYRLMVNCDDFGRMDGRAKILKSRLFPLKDITESKMLDALTEMVNADLIRLYYVEDKPFIQMKTWERHQQIRNHKSKYPSPDDNNCNQLKSIEINCNQLQSNDSKCPRNPIQSESESESLIADAEAREIQKEQNRVLDAAEDAGFKMSNDVRASLTALYADYGLSKVLDGLRSCSEHGAVNLAYLRAVLKGEPRKAKQDFQQRDYSGVEDDMMESLAREMAAFKGVS